MTDDDPTLIYDQSAVAGAFDWARKHGKASIRTKWSDGKTRYMNIVRQDDGSLPYSFDDEPIPCDS